MTKIIFLFKVFILYLFFFSNSYAKSSTSFFEQGKELFEKKKYDESKIFFQRDIVFNPKNERSYLYLAKIFEENDNVEEEEIKLNNVLLLNSTNDEALYMMILLKIKKSDYHSIKKRESSSADNDKSLDLDKSDDPIRMYLREMGGVELLSREGEIAIAKRIEAGKKVMTSALLQSPLMAKTVLEWKKKLEQNELLVREIVDIDSAYVDFDAEEESSISVKNKLKTKKEHKSEKLIKETKEDKDNKNNEEYSQEDEFNPSLAAMEEEIKPQVISTINILSKNYNKLIKYQNEKLNCVLNSKEFSRSKLTALKKNSK